MGEVGNVGGLVDGEVAVVEVEGGEGVSVGRVELPGELVLGVEVLVVGVELVLGQFVVSIGMIVYGMMVTGMGVTSRRSTYIRE